MLSVASFSSFRFGVSTSVRWTSDDTYVQKWRHFICGTYILLPANSSGKEWPKHLIQHHIIPCELFVWPLCFNTFNKIIVINNGCSSGSGSNNIIVIMRHKANTIEYINSKASFDYKRRVKYAQANIFQYSQLFMLYTSHSSHTLTRARGSIFTRSVMQIHIHLNAWQ